MSGDAIVSGVIQLALAVIASGVVVRMLTLRQDRRKIAGDATTLEANAASTLSGAALKMVEDARQSARDADIRAKHAEEGAEKCRSESDRLWRELNKARWRIYYLETRERVLVAAMQMGGIQVPDAPDFMETDIRSDEPPPYGAAPNPT